MAAQAKVLSGNKLEGVVVRLQKMSGRNSDQCWRFLIQHGLKKSTDYRRWSEEEIEMAREELVRRPLQEVAARLHRSPQAVRNMLYRSKLRMRDIRCDQFSLSSLSAALHVRKSEILQWIKEGWLEATLEKQGANERYVITPDALALMYKRHLQDLLKRGKSNLSLFEAYVQYCFSPKHTTGSQLLEVRRDKRERAAYASAFDGDEDASNNFEDDDLEDE
ncbi:hypothetical protein [Edaphobacter dinghuensis]|nr:hypothetical protein [Edaphobacter dinghuensis]